MPYFNLQLWIIVVFLAIECKPRPAALRCIAVYQTFPWVDNAGRLHGYERDSMLIYQVGQMVAYRFVIPIDSPFKKLVNGRHVDTFKTKWNYQYLVMLKCDRLGFLVDAAYPETNRWVNADSIFAVEAFWVNARMFHDILASNLAKLQTKTLMSNGNEQEIYQLTSLKDSLCRGELYMEFSKDLKDVTFSLSPHIDSLRPLKLVKTKVINKRRFLADYNITVDEFVSHDYQLKELLIGEETPQILKVFRLFKNQQKKRR